MHLSQLPRTMGAETEGAWHEGGWAATGRRRRVVEKVGFFFEQEGSLGLYCICHKLL